MNLRKGFDPQDRNRAAELYWSAFGKKLGRTLGPEPKALELLQSILQSDHAISAYSNENTLLGIVGFKTHQGAFFNPAFADLVRVYGRFGAAWRSLLLSLLVRDIDNERFLMDGLFVAKQARGQGVGKMLLAAIFDEARDRNYKQVRLDVVDTNPRAKSLYLQQGFKVTDTQNLGALRLIFGFKSADTMVADVGK